MLVSMTQRCITDLQIPCYLTRCFRHSWRGDVKWEVMEGMRTSFTYTNTSWSQTSSCTSMECLLPWGTRPLLFLLISLCLSCGKFTERNSRLGIVIEVKSFFQWPVASEYTKRKGFFQFWKQIFKHHFFGRGRSSEDSWRFFV